MGLLDRWDRRNARYLADIERQRREREATGGGDPGRLTRVVVGYQLVKLGLIVVLAVLLLVVTVVRSIL